MAGLLYSLWSEVGGQDIAEYAIMLVVILVVVVGTLRLIGSNDRRSSATSVAFTYLYFWGKAYEDLYSSGRFHRFYGLCPQEHQC